MLFQILVSIIMLIIIIVCSIQFALNVELSDICNKPKETIITAMNKYGNVDKSASKLIEYYVYCDDDHTDNQILGVFDTARSKISDGTRKLITYTQDIVSDLSRVSNKEIEMMNKIVSDSSQAINELDSFLVNYSTQSNETCSQLHEKMTSRANAMIKETNALLNNTNPVFGQANHMQIIRNALIDQANQIINETDKFNCSCIVDDIQAVRNRYVGHANVIINNAKNTTKLIETHMNTLTNTLVALFSKGVCVFIH